MNAPQKSTANLNIAISWVELPAYGARLIRAGVKELRSPVTVISALPSPVKGMDEIIGQKVHWVDRNSVNSWQDLNLPVPDVFFQAGWFVPSLNKLGADVRANGGLVVGLIDNCWKNNLRQWMGAVKFRLLYRKWFSAVWVPGKSGAHLLRFMGMPPSRIYQGLYGSDPDCFVPGPRLQDRPKQFIFVGQFIARKGISTLVRAFEKFHKKFPDWKIFMYGAGECRGIMEKCPGMVVCPFGNSNQISEALRSSRFLVLPSQEDHWPLVVSEAALSGCGLIVSDKVGNRFELLNEKNGFTFVAGAVGALAEKLKAAASMSDTKLSVAYNESLRLGLSYTPAHWAAKFKRIVSEVGGMRGKTDGIIK